MAEALSEIHLARMGAPLGHQVIVNGYYGFDNLGDELLLTTLIQQLGALQAERRNAGMPAYQITLTILSAHPEKTLAHYQSLFPPASSIALRSIGRTDVRAIITALRTASLWVSGGGGLFQDVTGPASPLYYGGLMQLAQWLGVPTVVWGQGLGPLKSAFSRLWTGHVWRQCAGVAVRDTRSAALATSIGVPGVITTADPVWMLDLASLYPPNQPERLDFNGSPYRLGISLREWPALTLEGITALAKRMAQQLSVVQQPAVVYLLPFQDNQDTQPLRQFEQALLQQPEWRNGSHSLCWVPSQEVLSAIAQCTHLVAMRYHAVILGLLAGATVTALPYDPKVATLQTQFNLSGCAVEQLSTQANTLAVCSVGQPATAAMQQQLTEAAARNMDVIRAVLFP